MGLGGANNYAQVTGIRFLLGVMEAGLFPGFVYYLTFWYRTSERSIRVALILASATLAGAFGGAIAYGVGHMNGARGLSAWRWLFFIEGAPSCASAFLVWFILPDYPESANWLTLEEKELAAQRLETEGSKGTAKAMSWADAKDVLMDWRLYGHYAVCLSARVLCMILISAALLWYLGSFLESVSLHAFDYKGSGILGSKGAIDDRTPVRRCLCCHRGCGWVGRLFQQVCIYSPCQPKSN